MVTSINEYEKIILGIDPGTNIMGYGLLGCNKKKYELISLGIINLKKMDNHAKKLKHIFERCTAVIDQYKPDEVAIEAPFYGKNPQSMLKLGRAQGVAMAAALNRGLPIFEYAPKKIKQSVTGNGNSSKEQVAAMLQTLLKFKDMPQFLDATDGLAIALCHFFQGSSSAEFSGAKYNSWKSFIANNPDKVK